MDGYELRDHRSQQLFRPIGGYFANFSSSAGRISEAIYSQQAVYLSYTYYDPSLDLHDDAGNLYEDVGEVAMTLINLRYAQAQEKIRRVLT
jgi:hypothetical protein